MYRRPSLVLPLAALALAIQPLVIMRSDADRKISHILNAAAINDKAERSKVKDAAHDNNFTALPPAEVKPAEEVRTIMLDHKLFFHPKP